MLVNQSCVIFCRVWFLLAWKERLLDVVVKIEKRRKVRAALSSGTSCMPVRLQLRLDVCCCPSAG